MRDQLASPPGVALSPQPRHAVLGHHVVGEVARRRHARARRRAAPRSATPLPSRRRSTGSAMIDRPPAARARAEHEVELAADPRHLAAAHALGVDLAEEVHLEGRVHRDEVAERGRSRRDRGVTSDGSMLIGGFSWLNAKSRARAHDLADVHPAADGARFRALVMTPRLDQRQHRARRAASARRGRRWSPSASMMACGIAPTPTWMVAPSAISAATWPAMRALDLAHRRRRVLDERLVDLDPAVDLGAVQHAVAESARHARVHLGDDERRAPGRGERDSSPTRRARGSRARSGGAVWTSTASGAHGPPAANSGHACRSSARGRSRRRPAPPPRAGAATSATWRSGASPRRRARRTDSRRAGGRPSG